MSMANNDLDDLKYAKILLENVSLVAKISNLLGAAIEKGFEYLPAKWNDVVQGATKKSLEKALSFAVLTMNERTKPASSNKTHKILTLNMPQNQKNTTEKETGHPFCLSI